MPRQPRWDAPETLHHVMVRGLERHVIFKHLNPLRAQVLLDLRHLDRYPWTGHSALLGTVARPWQDTAAILAQFGATPRRPLAAYRAFVAEGLPQGRRPELQGGGWSGVSGAGRR